MNNKIKAQFVIDLKDILTLQIDKQSLFSARTTSD